MKAYKICLNGMPCVINYAEGNITDPYEPTDYAFSNGRTAQKVLRKYKRMCVSDGLDISLCQFTIECGEFIPYPEDDNV